MLDKAKYFDLAGKECHKIFKSKKRMRKVWAQEPMGKKLEDLIKLQEMMVNINPKLKENKLIPWKRIKKEGGS